MIGETTQASCATEMPCTFARPGRTLLLAFLGIDLLFKCLVTPAFAKTLGARTPADLGRVSWTACILFTPVALAWLGSLWLAVRPVDRFLELERAGALSPEGLAALGVRLQRLPLALTLLFTIEWLGSYAGLMAAYGAPIGLAPPAFLLAALCLGPASIGFALTVRVIVGPLRRLSLVARARRVEIGATSSRLRTGLVFISLCLAVAPTLYIASVAFAVRAQPAEAGELMGLVLLVTGTVVTWAVITAFIVAQWIAEPTREMAELMSAITAQGDAAHVSRLPTLPNNEIGLLAGSINAMLDRLEVTEARRAEASESLAALNQSLEERVRERTERLESANRSLAGEMKARLLMEVELRQAQKLESVGRLAAGVAHEINTPVQFVSDSIHFLRDATTDLMGVVEKLRVVQRSILEGATPTQAAAEAEAVEEEADLPYLLENVPKAFDRSLDGLGRVATIVRSMKEFAHPDSTRITTVDLNRAIETTLTVARNEYRDVADIELELGDIPAMSCHAGDLNQVFLHIIVNAAHAIADVVKGTEKRGIISVKTSRDGEHVKVAISDTGSGIKEEILERIFDPFFTTKEVGKGSGQGLAVARSIVVDRHGGDISVETEVGRGTTFVIRLPMAGPVSRRRELAA